MINQREFDLTTPDSPSDRQDGPALVVDVEGFEGPLDLLLGLARDHKVDLSQISMLALAEQYLAFISKLRDMRLEIAADYLVMAAWLAYLKSRLLLPNPEDDEPTGDELAAILAFRLKRLEAMRHASERLMNRNRLGRDVFARGDPEPISVTLERRYDTTLYDLLSAYAAQRQRTIPVTMRVAARTVWSLQDAHDLLIKLVGSTRDWTSIDSFLCDYLVDADMRPTVIASSFSASLELAREGKLELRQSGPFQPLYMRSPPTITSVADKEDAP